MLFCKGVYIYNYIYIYIYYTYTHIAILEKTNTNRIVSLIRFYVLSYHAFPVSLSEVHRVSGGISRVQQLVEVNKCNPTSEIWCNNYYGFIGINMDTNGIIIGIYMVLYGLIWINIPLVNNDHLVLNEIWLIMVNSG